MKYINYIFKQCLLLYLPYNEVPLNIINIYKYKSTYTDSAGATTCARVYPDVQQLLCRWHVDRYAHLCTYVCLWLCVCITRAWQRKLYSEVKNDENRAQMYACLSLLISEQDVATFLKNQEMFTTYWQTREPGFIKYYEKEYSNRAGMVVKTSLYINTKFNLEKWALCYRHFDHADVDTNMLVERYSTIRISQSLNHY